MEKEKIIERLKQVVGLIKYELSRQSHPGEVNLLLNSQQAIAEGMIYILTAPQNTKP